MADRALVLLSNDDGFDAEGLLAVRAALMPHADVVICAPLSNQSATSHSLTLHRPLRLKRMSEGVFALDGTPADCVYVALSFGDRVLPRRPDLCVSGLNHGLNLAVDVFYSGTVAAAREAALRKVPAIALSADLRADRRRAAEAGASIALTLLKHRSLFGSVPLLNVNFPPRGPWALCATKLGKREYDGDVAVRTDPRGDEYLWIGGAAPKHFDSGNSDTDAFDRGDVGITPLSLNLSEPDDIEATSKVAEASGSV